MITLNLDGSKMFTLCREKDGTSVLMVSDNIGLKPGQQRLVNKNDLSLPKPDVVINIPDSATFTNIISALLSYCERHEVLHVLGKTPTWASFTVKSKGVRKDEENNLF